MGSRRPSVFQCHLSELSFTSALYVDCARGNRRSNLFHLGSFEFYPAGADTVRIRFTQSAEGLTLTVHDPDVVLTAVRTA